MTISIAGVFSGKGDGGSPSRWTSKGTKSSFSSMEVACMKRLDIGLTLPDGVLEPSSVSLFEKGYTLSTPPGPQLGGFPAAPDAHHDE